MHAVEFPFRRQTWLALLWINKHLLACKPNGARTNRCPFFLFARPLGTVGSHNHSFSYRKLIFARFRWSMAVVRVLLSIVHVVEWTVAQILYLSACDLLICLNKTKQKPRYRNCTAAVVTLIATTANWIYLQSFLSFSFFYGSVHSWCAIFPSPPNWTR